ncbi:MAG: LysR family transcriptional regulator [Pseudomonadota bacterium]
MRHTLPLKYIDAVARTRSIRAAAEQLSITASALNRRILAMEEELGVELFERHSSGVRMNAAGEIFVQHVRTQMADLERVRSRIADLKGVRLGHVRIAATRTVTRYFLPREIQKYRAEFPGVTFDVRSMHRRDAEEALATNEVDIAVVLEPVRMAEFQSLLLIQQPLHCVISGDHPLAKRQSVGLMEVLQHDLLLSPRGEGIREKLEGATSAKGLKLVPAVESNDSSFLEALAREGGGIAFSIPVGIDGQASDGSLVHIPLNARDAVSPFLFVGQERQRALPVAVGKFVEELKKVLET